MDQIIAKIQKLMAKANGTDNEHEAAAFMEKAHAMLAEHNLSISQIAIASDTPDISSEQFEDPRAYLWVKQLWMACGKLYFCEYYYVAIKGHKALHTLIGRPHNRLMAEQMARYLVATVFRLSREAKKDSGGDARYEGAFQRGCSSRLIHRVHQKYKDATAPAPAATSSTFGLPALYNSEETLIKEFLDSQKLDLRTRKTSSKVGDREGYFAGRDAAEKVSLNDQVAASRTASRHLIGA